MHRSLFSVRSFPSLSYKAMSFKLFLAASLILIIAIFLASVHESENQDKNINLQIIQISGAVGPESFAFHGDDDDDDGGPYTGVSDGRIIKWQRNESRWINFAVTSPERSDCESSESDIIRKEDICGRPLGLCFNKETSDLYIADAYMGLLVVGSAGGLAKQLVKEARGIPLRFTNSLDIDQTTGVVYFTDSSTRFQRRNYVSVIISGDNTGRLLKYDPRTNEVTVLLDNLMFPNGVALSKNGDFILIAETTNCRILRFWLEPSKVGRIEVFAELPGYPDNIKRNKKGEFWVAIHSRKGKFLKWILSYSWIRNGLITQLPFDITSVYSYFADFFGSGLAIKLDETRDVLGILEDHKGKRWKHISEAYEKNGYLWIGSVKMPFAVKLKMISQK